MPVSPGHARPDVGTDADGRERSPADLGSCWSEASAYTADQLSLSAGCGRDRKPTWGPRGAARLYPASCSFDGLLRMSEGCNARTWLHVQFPPTWVGSTPPIRPFPSARNLRHLSRGSRPSLPTIRGSTNKPTCCLRPWSPLQSLYVDHNEFAIFTVGVINAVACQGSRLRLLSPPSSAAEAGRILMFEEVLGPENGSSLGCRSYQTSCRAAGSAVARLRLERPPYRPGHEPAGLPNRFRHALLFAPPPRAPAIVMPSRWFAGTSSLADHGVTLAEESWAPCRSVFVHASIEGRRTDARSLVRSVPVRFQAGLSQGPLHACGEPASRPYEIGGTALQWGLT